MLPRSAISSLKAALPHRTFATSARVASGLPRNPVAPLASTETVPRRRGVASTPPAFDPQEPSHAAVKEDIVIPYPECVGPLPLLRSPYLGPLPRN